MSSGKLGTVVEYVVEEMRYKVQVENARRKADREVLVPPHDIEEVRGRSKRRAFVKREWV